MTSLIFWSPAEQHPHQSIFTNFVKAGRCPDLVLVVSEMLYT